ncbi:hypothetical protein DAI22_06g234000 [Oryza sativa Japonica Group]|nr:hypothetical protein DAI22_06g234000 [Oryza sativa Japonica Group]
MGISSAAGPLLCSLRSPPPTASVFPWPKATEAAVDADFILLRAATAPSRAPPTRPPPSLARVAGPEAASSLRPCPAGSPPRRRRHCAVAASANRRPASTPSGAPLLPPPPHHRPPPSPRRPPP